MAQKVIIRTPNHLGDCIMALPMINQAGEAYPGARISLLAPRQLAPLFRSNPVIDEIIELPPEHTHGLMAVYKVKDLIASHAFDIGYVLPPSFGAAAGFKLGGVKERIGYIADGRRLLLSRPLPLPAPLNSKHRSELYSDLLRRAAGQELAFGKPKLFLSDEDVRGGVDLLAGFGIAESDSYVAVAFRAVAESRRWGAENYTALIKQLISHHRIKVVLIGTAEDRTEGDAIAEATSTKEVVTLAGKTSIREAAGVLSRAKLFIGNDSGPAHLAAAVGTPIVVLSGADDPKATTPLAARKKLLYQEKLNCISCEKNKCPLKGDGFMLCMKSISVELVAASAGDFLENLI